MYILFFKYEKNVKIYYKQIIIHVYKRCSLMHGFNNKRDNLNTQQDKTGEDIIIHNRIC